MVNDINCKLDIWYFKSSKSRTLFIWKIGIINSWESWLGLFHEPAKCFVSLTLMLSMNRLVKKKCYGWWSGMHTLQCFILDRQLIKMVSLSIPLPRLGYSGFFGVYRYPWCSWDVVFSCFKTECLYFRCATCLFVCSQLHDSSILHLLRLGVVAFFFLTVSKVKMDPMLEKKRLVLDDGREVFLRPVRIKSRNIGMVHFLFDSE